MQVAPNTAENAFLDGAPTGLVGTLKFKVVDTSGTAVIAETTSGITEIDTGIYRKPFTSPSTIGDYLIIWTNGTTKTSEQLTVTYSLGSVPTPSGSDLTTLAAVKEQLQASDSLQDSVIQRLITRYSDVCMHYANREFAPTSANIARTYAYGGSGTLNLSPYDVRTVTAVSIDVQTTSPTVLTTDQYTVRPKPNREGVYMWLKLPTRERETEVSITGDWGFASVPATVEEACIIAVVSAVRTHVSAFTTTYDVQDPVTPGVQGLPWASKRLLDFYARKPVG